jgi:hypothetical protein
VKQAVGKLRLITRQASAWVHGEGVGTTKHGGLGVERGRVQSILETITMVSQDVEQAGTDEPGKGSVTGVSAGKRARAQESQGEHGQGSGRQGAQCD